MGNDDADSSISALYESLSQSFNRSGFAAVFHLYHSARIAAQQATLASVAASLRSLYRNESLNWGQVALLSTCFITMVGCGLLSSLIWRGLSLERKSSSRPRTGLRMRSTRSSTKTLTSSDDDYEDDDYDSNDSLRHGTEPHRQATEWSSEPQQQTSDGERNFLPGFSSLPAWLGKPLTFQQLSRQIPVS